MSKLICRKGNNKGDEFAIHEGKTIIGRSQDCHITLFDKKCSRHHCQIIKKGNHYAIQDLDSSNGTFLNGKDVHDKPRTCREGDTIIIGRTRLEISQKPLGNVVDQAATDVAAELQSGKYKELLTTTSRNMHNGSSEKERKGFLEFFKSLFNK